MPLPLAAGGGSGEASPDEEAAELLSTLGSLLTAPSAHPATPLAAAPSPLLSSPSPALGGGAGQAAGAEAASDAQQKEEEEAAVKAFVHRLPAQGVSRHDLSLQLLWVLGTASAAAKLSPPARQQLLQVAHTVQHSVHDLPPGHYLTLGELFADAAAASAAADKRVVVPLPSAPVGGSPQQGRASGAVRRPSGRATRRTGLSTAVLQQSARLWLSRFRLAAAEGADAGASSDEQPPASMIRYWWATGRLLESAGDMIAASAAYATCSEGLPMLGAFHCSCGRCLRCPLPRRLLPLPHSPFNRLPC